MYFFFSHLVFLLFVFPDLCLNFFFVAVDSVRVKVTFCVVRHRCVPVHLYSRKSKVESRDMMRVKVRAETLR